MFIDWNGFKVNSFNIPRPLPGLYRATNLNNGKCYIGISVNVAKRGKDHTTITCRKFYNGLRKHGLSAFLFEPLCYSIDGSTDWLPVLESEYIREFNSIKNGYNVLAASNGVGPAGDEFREIQRATALRPEQRILRRKASDTRWAKPGAREAASARQSARYTTEEGRAAAREMMNRPETVAKLSAAAKRQFEDPAQLEINRQHGLAQYATEEARLAAGKRIREIHARPEVKAKVIASAIRRGANPDERARRSARMKGKPAWNAGLKTGPQSEEERARRSAILTEVCKRPEIREMRRQAALVRWTKHRENHPPSQE